MNTLLAELRPIVHVGQSGLLSWLITLVILCVAVTVIVWLVSKFAGPPNIPEPFRWIIWVIVAIVLLVMILAAFGVAL